MSGFETSAGYFLHKNSTVSGELLVAAKWRHDLSPLSTASIFAPIKFLIFLLLNLKII